MKSETVDRKQKEKETWTVVTINLKTQENKSTPGNKSVTPDPPICVLKFVYTLDNDSLKLTLALRKVFLKGVSG